MKGVLTIKDLMWRKHPMDPSGHLCTFTTPGTWVSIARTEFTFGRYQVFTRPLKARNKHSGHIHTVIHLGEWISDHAFDLATVKMGAAA